MEGDRNGGSMREELERRKKRREGGMNERGMGGRKGGRNLGRNMVIQKIESQGS